MKSNTITLLGLGIVAHTSNPSYSGGRGRMIPNLRPGGEKLVRLCLKNKTKGLGSVVQVGEHYQHVRRPWVPSPLSQKQTNKQIKNLFGHQ
jgi:hypothetical protein